MAWMLGKDGKMVFVEPGTPVYGEIPAPLAMNIVNPQDGQALVYDGEKGEWVNGGSFDPTITDPQDGQVLVYDGTAGKWVNGAASGGMVVPVITTVDVGETWTCSHTYAEIMALITAGKCNQIKMVSEGAVPFLSYWPLRSINSEFNEITFTGCDINEDNLLFTNIYITPEGVTVEEATYPDDTSPL